MDKEQSIFYKPLSTIKHNIQNKRVELCSRTYNDGPDIEIYYKKSIKRGLARKEFIDNCLEKTLNDIASKYKTPELKDEEDTDPEMPDLEYFINETT